GMGRRALDYRHSGQHLQYRAYLPSWHPQDPLLARGDAGGGDGNVFVVPGHDALRMVRDALCYLQRGLRFLQRGHRAPGLALYHLSDRSSWGRVERPDLSQVPRQRSLEKEGISIE